MKKREPHVLVICALLLCIACADSKTPSGPAAVPVDDGTYVMTIVSPPPRTDTVQSQESLVVRITRKDGTPRDSSIVVFTAVTEAGVGVATTRLMTKTDTARRFVASVPTDENGEAAITVVHGTVVRKETVSIESPASRITQFVDYFTTVGNLNQVMISPTDTIAATGETVHFRSATVDRFGNKRSDAVTFFSGLDGNVASITADGDVVASKHGVQAVFARGVAASGASTTSVAYLLVPPENPILWTPAGSDGLSSGGGIVQGTAYSATTTTVLPPPTTAVAVVSGSSQLAFAVGSALVIRSQNGNETRFDVGQIDAKVAISPDGSTVYYTHETAFTPGIYRTPTSTFSPVLLVGNDTAARAPAISPDGKRMAYTELQQLRILDLTTGSISVLPLPNAVLFPEWSPDGGRLAYIRVTGTSSTRTLGIYDFHTATETIIGGSWTANSALTWSPDSEWLIAWNTTNRSATLIHAGDSRVYPLKSVGANPVWQR